MSQRATRNYKQKSPFSIFGQFALPLAAVVAVGILFLGVKLFFSGGGQQPPTAEPITEPAAIAPTTAVTEAPYNPADYNAAEPVDDESTPAPPTKTPPKPTRTPAVTKAPGVAPSKAPDTATAVTPATGTGAKSSSYIVQIGAFGTKDAADALAAKVGTEGFTASISEATVGDKKYFRVRVSGGNNKSEAAAAAESLKAKGYPVQIMPVQ